MNADQILRFVADLEAARPRSPRRLPLPEGIPVRKAATRAAAAAAICRGLRIVDGPDGPEVVAP